MTQIFNKVIFVTHPLWPSMLPRKTYPRPLSERAAINLAIHNRGHLLPPKTEVNLRYYRASEVKKFINDEALATISAAQKNAVVVLVKTPSPAERTISRIGVEQWQVAAKTFGFGDYAKLDFQEKSGLRKKVFRNLSIIYGESQTAQRAARGIEKSFRKKLANEFGERLIEPKGRYGLESIGIANEVDNILAKKRMWTSDTATIVGLGAFAKECAIIYPVSYARLEQGRKVALPRKGTFDPQTRKPIFRRPKHP